jgi:hypothetical protein
MFFRLFALSLSALSGCVGFSEVAPIETGTERAYPKLLPIDHVVTTSIAPTDKTTGKYLLQRSAQLKRKRDVLNRRGAANSESNS